ncbi:unnamed protein product, partial [Mesorhabditis belari]|uniref:Uncharacterized protein n=1 Tax=Mesorhabditis belari TaxID=2138241 RepID=A0AAF3EF20_9BILA
MKELLYFGCLLIVVFGVENAQNTRSRLQDLNERASRTAAKKERPRIETVTVDKEKMAELEPRVLLFPVSQSPPGNAVMTQKDQPKGMIVSSQFNSLMLGAVIQPPLPGATHPPLTTRNPRDGTPVPTTTPFSIHDVRPAPKAASFQGALFGGSKVSKEFLKGDWIKKSDEESEESSKETEKPKKKHSRKTSKKSKTDGKTGDVAEELKH